jgi:hypothetical protein
MPSCLATARRGAGFSSTERANNSQIPTGFHNGRTIYYLFGRYPSDPDGNDYPVIDFVLCHGDFLNADHEYVHKNTSVRGFASYGHRFAAYRLKGSGGPRVRLRPKPELPEPDDA